MVQLLIKNQISIEEIFKSKNKEILKLLNDMNIYNIDTVEEYNLKNKILLEKLYNLSEKYKISKKK